MSTPQEPRELEELDGLVTLAQRSLQGQAAHRGERTFERVQERLQARRDRARFRTPVPLWRWTLPVVALGAVGLYAWQDSRETLDYEVRGAVAMASGDIVGGEQSRLLFTDGSELTLSRNARARVASLDANGGHIELASGKAHVAIEKRPTTKWFVHAGPYEVRVTGTAFDVRWAASEQTFELSMDHGEVYVTGPLLDGAVRLRAGQSVRVALDKQSVWIGDNALAQAEPAPAASDRDAEAGDDAASAPARASEPRAKRGRSAGDGKTPWAQRLARGDFHGVVQDARRMGVDRALSSVPLAELSALADAARFVREHDLARRALMAARRRFPRSAIAADAAFLLGRLEEQHDGQSDEARSWYARYLQESPRGPYAGQALGRRMLQVYRSEGATAARELASRYLERHAAGSYADTARHILGGAPSETSLPRR